MLLIVLLDILALIITRVALDIYAVRGGFRLRHLRLVTYQNFAQLQ